MQIVAEAVRVLCPNDTKMENVQIVEQFSAFKTLQTYGIDGDELVKKNQKRLGAKRNEEEKPNRVSAINQKSVV